MGMRARVYRGECWWCEAPANSREHRHKRSDLIREFGPGPYLGDDALVRGVAGRPPREVRGPNSKQFKFEATLCERCNSARSQSFDRAYEHFAAFIRDNEREILKVGAFRWSNVYGTLWRTRLVDLKRYFAKHLACRMAEAHLQVDENLTLFLDGSTTDLASLSIEFEIRSDIEAALGVLEGSGIASGSLWLGELTGMKSRSTGEMLSLSSFLGFGWLRVNYRYGGAGSIVTNSIDDVVRLPRGYNVDPSQFSRSPNPATLATEYPQPPE